MQTMFLAYLRDREIVDRDYLVNTSAKYKINNVDDIFRQQDAGAFNHLIGILDEDFNGGLFFKNPLYQ